MNKIIAALAVVGALSGGVATAQTMAPPPPVEEAGPPPPAPGPNYVLAPGYYAWVNGQYVWTPRHWMVGRVGFHWVPPHWAVGRLGRWHFVQGHWAR